MATIATAALKVVGYYGFPAAHEVRASPEGASETYVKGMFLVDDGSGRLQAVTSDSTANIVGVAARDGQNNSTEAAVDAEFYPLTPLSLLELNLLEASDAAHVLALTDLWAAIDYQLTGTVVKITGDQGAGTSMLTVVKIELSAGKGVIDDSNARVLAVPYGNLCITTPDA